MRETNAVVWAKYKSAVTVIELTGPSSWSHFSMASSSSSSSLSPPGVPMELHVTNREKLLSSLRHDLSHSSRPLHGFVFLQVLTMNEVSKFWNAIFLQIFLSTKRFSREAMNKRATILITSNSSGTLSLPRTHTYLCIHRYIESFTLSDFFELLLGFGIGENYWHKFDFFASWWSFYSLIEGLVWSI